MLDLMQHAMHRAGKQCGKLALEIIFSAGLSDKIQHRQTFLAFRKPQTSPKLLEKYGPNATVAFVPYGRYTVLE